MVTFQEFESASLAEGFDEVVPRAWPAANVQPTHTHPFAVKAMVAEGEMWLTVGDETRHLTPGDTFELDRHQPHAERYGEAGATYWAARHN